MRIEHLKIHNFRSISDLEINCQPLVVLLGANNHGKSNIISAIEFALTTSAKITESDIFAFCGEDRSLWVEITFAGLTEQEKNTFRKYVRMNGTFCIRKTANVGAAGTVETFYNGYVEEPTEPWLHSDNARELANREQISATPLAALVPQTGRLTQANILDAQTEYIREHRDQLQFIVKLESSPFLGQRNVAGGVLPDFFLIPAVKDLADETKVKSTSTFGRLLSRAVREMAERDARFRDLKAELARLVDALVNGSRKLTHFSRNRKTKIDPPSCQLSICTDGVC